ncbi:MAG TPA: hypothetical protein VK970_12275 [Candidatus Methylacidiphilales bacterium]|nr:hypothetical protein [Candidatus Methylacidiphilales bacterium]
MALTSPFTQVPEVTKHVSGQTETFNPAEYTAHPERSAICHVDAVREVAWKLPVLELPPIAYLAFVSTIVAVSLLGITFTARQLMTPWGRRSFQISAGIASAVALISVIFTVYELRNHPPAVQEEASEVRLLADLRILEMGRESDLLGNDKITVDVTAYPGRQMIEIRPNMTIRLWTSHMTQKGIFLMNYALEVPANEKVYSGQGQAASSLPVPAASSNSSAVPATTSP